MHDRLQGSPLQHFQMFGWKTSSRSVPLLSLSSDCVSRSRSGLDRDSQNLGSCVSWRSGLPELEAVRDAVLRSQPHLGPRLQTGHAGEPQVPHGGAETERSALVGLLTRLTLVSCLFQSGQEEEAVHVFKQMFEMNVKGNKKAFPVRSEFLTVYTSCY